MPDDFGYFGKGITGYAQYMTAFNRNNGGGQEAVRRQRRLPELFVVSTDHRFDLHTNLSDIHREQRPA